jgi:hypothetical protein
VRCSSTILFSCRKQSAEDRAREYAQFLEDCKTVDRILAEHKARLSTSGGSGPESGPSSPSKDAATAAAAAAAPTTSMSMAVSGTCTLVFCIAQLVIFVVRSLRRCPCWLKAAPPTTPCSLRYRSDATSPCTAADCSCLCSQSTVRGGMRSLQERAVRVRVLSDAHVGSAHAALVPRHGDLLAAVLADAASKKVCARLCGNERA